MLKDNHTLTGLSQGEHSMSHVSSPIRVLASDITDLPSTCLTLYIYFYRNDTFTREMFESYNQPDTRPLGISHHVPLDLAHGIVVSA